MPWLRSLLPGKTGKTLHLPPCPDQPVCIIGDLHGRADLLERMLQLVAAESGSNMARLIFVGDLIDRGPDGAVVLARVRQLVEDTPGQVVCLMGNHERMLLDFLDDPVKAARWLHHGGVETLTSLGVPSHTHGETAEARLRSLVVSLRNALPAGTEAWLRALPAYWQEADLAAVHAGADPDSPIETQSDQTLIWGHRNFLSRSRRDALWVVHGHSVVQTATASAGRIAVDTGAWQSGRLSAAWLDTQGLRFIEAT